MILRRDKDTICAVATPGGVGGISVIRISGKNSLGAVQKIAPFLKKKSIESHRAYFGVLINPENSEPLDEVVLTYFSDGKSFTGEETVEISCHGNPVICESILQSLVQSGCRLAERGEFTYRAFMHGRLDLVQAESILSLIEGESRQATQLALRQLKGDLSSKLVSIEDRLTWLLAHIEAGIDFSTEGLEIIDRDLLLRKLSELREELSQLASSFKVGRVLRDGIRVVLTGVPNVGKSSLLNNLLEDDRAIVTEVPGTTRDLLDGDTIFGGIKFNLVDTAGLRESADKVEQIGIQRSYQAQRDADVVAFVFDQSRPLSEQGLDVLKAVDRNRLWIVGNKADLVSNANLMNQLGQKLVDEKIFPNMREFADFSNSRVFFLSALDKNSRSAFLGPLAQHFMGQNLENSAVLSNARHFENVGIALQNVVRSIDMAQAGDGAEYLAFEMKEALLKVQETLGKRFDDQIMDRVFKEFCIGK